MRNKVTIFFTVLLAMVVLASGTELKVQKPLKGKIRTDVKSRNASQEKISFSDAIKTETSLQKTNAVRKTAEASHVQVGLSGNGYGWLNPMQRSIGRFVGDDIDTGDPLDYLLVGFRGHGDGNADMAVSEINLESGLSNGTLSTWEGSASAINNSITPYGNGARYPCVVALERPLICFNQYAPSGAQGDPANAHPYMITDYTTYGPSAGAWTAPDYLMDNGWVNPTVATLSMTSTENRLWNGPVSVVRDGDDIYHYVGVYETWYTATEESFYGVGNEDHIINAHSSDTDLSYGWTMGWDEDNDPVLIDTNEVQIYRKGVDLNSSGFGVLAGPGHLGNSDPDKDYYFAHTRITFTTTDDFGLTWAAWDTVSLTDMGFPNYIHEEEKMIIWDIVGTDTTWYDGPAFLGNNFNMSVMVDDDNAIYVGFSMLWGASTVDGWYPNYNYSGVFVAKSTDGGTTWGAGRIALNNGIYVGDDDLGVSAYFFDNETQISKDDQGNLYATWLDRRRTGTQISAFQKYTDPEEATGYNDYKTDIYASHSIDGGASWTQAINLTDTPSLDEYELNMALTSRNQDTPIEGDYGRIWVGYVLADTAAGTPATDALIELSNAVWVAEAQEFNSPSSVSDKDGNIAEKFALSQNYPNPFNPTTRIEVVPLKSGHTTLTVYNLTGQKIKTLFDGQVTKGNPFTVDFDGTNIAAGIYFYRLTNGQNVEVKKMALIK